MQQEAGGAQQAPDQTKELFKVRDLLSCWRLFGPVQQGHGLLHPSGDGFAQQQHTRRVLFESANAN